jgi:dTMP kinase
VREILLGTDSLPDPWSEALLFAAARSQLASEIIQPALLADQTVVSDRSVYSSLAYQGVARGLGVAEVRSVNEAGLQGVWPDTVILLKIAPARGLAREDESDRISVEGLELQQSVAEAYDALASEDPQRFVVVDADAGIDEVVRQSLDVLDERW